MMFIYNKMIKLTFFIENCPLSETILSLEEPSFHDFIFIGVTLILFVAAEIDKEMLSKPNSH